MVIATFNATTGWAGKTITHDDGVFTLEGHGTITAQDVLSYDEAGQIEWAYDGLKDWTGQLFRPPIEDKEPEAEGQAMGSDGTQHARRETAKERKTSVLASLGRGPGRQVEVFADRVEAYTTGPKVACSKKLAKAEGPGRFGWKVMHYESGVQAEVVNGDPGTAATSRVTVTRLLALGVFALAAPKKSGGKPPTAVLFIANEAGEYITVTLDAARIGEAKIVESAINGASSAFGASS